MSNLIEISSGLLYPGAPYCTLVLPASGMQTLISLSPPSVNLMPIRREPSVSFLFECYSFLTPAVLLTSAAIFTKTQQLVISHTLLCVISLKDIDSDTGQSSNHKQGTKFGCHISYVIIMRSSVGRNQVGSRKSYCDYRAC